MNQQTVVSSSRWFGRYPIDPLRPWDESIAMIRDLCRPDERTVGNVRQALDRVDLARFRAFLQRHMARFENLDPVGQYKYADLPFWTFLRVELAQRLGLDAAPPMNILDVGAGAGLFGLVAQSMGHSVIATDVANPWYDELCGLFGVPRLVAPVVAGEAYCVSGGPFDLISIMHPAFHRRSLKGGGREYWPSDRWAALLFDLGSHLLAHDGRIVLIMPYDKLSDGSAVPSPIIDWSLSSGARRRDAYVPGDGALLSFDRDVALGMAC